MRRASSNRVTSPASWRAHGLSNTTDGFLIKRQSNGSLMLYSYKHLSVGGRPSLCVGKENKKICTIFLLKRNQNGQMYEISKSKLK